MSTETNDSAGRCNPHCMCEAARGRCCRCTQSREEIGEAVLAAQDARWRRVEIPDSEEEIARQALTFIEEIACERSGLSETPNERAWAEVYRVAHWATAPDCRKNHPDFGKGLAEPVRSRTP